MKLQPFGGESSKWREWRFTIENVLSMAPLHKLMKWAEKAAMAELLPVGFSEDKLEAMRFPYAVSVQVGTEYLEALQR